MCLYFIVPNNDSWNTLNNKQQKVKPWSHIKASGWAVNLCMKKQVVFLPPLQNNTSGMSSRNHFRWGELQGNRRRLWRGGGTDLWESRGSWVLSQDSQDPVSQVGAGSLPQAQIVTVNVSLAWLRSWLQEPRGKPQQPTAPHTERHLDLDI